MAVLVGWQALAAYLSRRHYERLPTVTAPACRCPPMHKYGTGGNAVVRPTDRSRRSAAMRPRSQAAPQWQPSPLPVSVIIPARDEAANLPALLRSLAAQERAPAQIIVVDDQSSDTTAAIAVASGATVVASPGPPAGWTGKNYACYLGARAAVQPWLLFLDADVTLGPAAITATLDHALRQGVDGVSLFLQQRCGTFWERLLLPYAYAQYFIGVRPGAPLANGQFILLSAAGYGRCGGHAAVRASVIDDVALARQCRDTGVSLQMARGEAVASVRMYRGLRAIWEGFSKNSFRFVAADPLGGALTVVGSIAATALVQLSARAWRHGGAARAVATIASYAIAAHGLRYWARLFRAGPLAAPLYPLSSLVFMAIALNSTLRVVPRRGVMWKGRVVR